MLSNLKNFNLHNTIAMRYLSQIFAVILCFWHCHIAFAQLVNVDRTAMSYFDGPQTFRALEYSIDPNPQKIYRLETLPENGFPAIILHGDDNGASVYFEDKFPYDDQYTDNQTQYLSAEAVQTFYGFQRVMKAFDQRFGWKGIDGIGIDPINIYLEDSDDNPSEPVTFSQHYKDENNEYFEFVRSLSDNQDFRNTIDIVAHEYTHAIFTRRTSIINDNQYQCNEYRTLNEGIADIFGVYIKNKIKQSSQQNYNWLFGDQVYGPTKPFYSPKSFQFADTYQGEFYENVCTENYKPHPGAGIAQKWFYLLSEGFQGSAYNDLGYGYSDLEGIGVEKAIDIVWDAVPSIKVYSDYPAFRIFTLKAAEKLYGLHSKEYLAVKNAWCAVGVCDNNPDVFSMSPANATTNINPWPTVNINLTWQNDQVHEWEVQMSTKYDFSENLQTVNVSNFATVVGQNGLLQYTGTATGYYHPGEKVYARAKISKAASNFCKVLNPLCPFYQQFGPTHAFLLDGRKVEFWSNNFSILINPWGNPELSWKSVNGSHRYRIQVSTDNAFNNITYDNVSSHTGNFIESGKINTVLEIGKDYYARVRAERINALQIQKNYGDWSNIINLHTVTPQTSIIQALSQNANDPATSVSSLGFPIGWQPYPGASNYIIQVADDDAFVNIVRSKTVAGNLVTTEMLLPAVPDQTELFVRVLPQKGAVFGNCTNTWRIKTNQKATVPAMKDPADGSSFPFKNFLGSSFEWKGGTLNLNLVDHFELHVTGKTSNLTSIFTTQGKVFKFAVQDPLMFGDKQGLQVGVLAVNSLGAKSALSIPFNYVICPDHPGVFFPGDLGKVDPSKNFNIEWHPSGWFDPGSQFLVTIKQAGNVVAGFDNKPTTNNFMLVPAGTLLDGKDYVLTVKNSSACAGILLPVTFFSAKTVGGSNQPQPPKLVNFNVELKGFRNDPDGAAWGTSNYRLGIELIDPDGNLLALVDPNGNQVNQFDVDSENSGIVLAANDKPQGIYKLRLKMLNIFPPLTYYPFDQPRFSVLLNGQPMITNHVITADFIDPGSPFNEWQNGFQFADIVLDVK